MTARSRDEWRGELRSIDRLRWRDTLPTAVVDPAIAAEYPPLIRAIDWIR